MKRLKYFLLPLTLALFWFGSGYAVMWGLSNIFSSLAPYMFQCALINMIIGLGTVALITRAETGMRLFYDGPREEDETIKRLVIAILWALPVVFLFVGLVWWALGYLIRWLE